MGIVTGLMVVLSTYIFGNYAVAAPLQQTPVPSQPVHASEEQNRWQTLDTHAHVIVYRDDGNASLPSKTVLNIFVNGQYHTSVLPNFRAVELLLCPGKKAVNVSLSQLDQHRFAKLTKVEEISPTLQAGERYYIHVALDNQGKITAQWAPEKEAKSTLDGFEPQTRTLSRVLNERYCPDVTYTINSAKIFTHHNNSTSLSAEGDSTLAALVKSIDSEFQKVDKVVVKNYSDINGKGVTAHPLSQMRANSVTTWLVNSHFPSPLFMAQGKDLNCSAISDSKHDGRACLDFRKGLDVEVYGVRRNSRSPQ